MYIYLFSGAQVLWEKPIQASYTAAKAGVRRACEDGAGAAIVATALSRAKQSSHPRLSSCVQWQAWDGAISVEQGLNACETSGHAPSPVWEASQSTLWDELDRTVLGRTA